MESIRDREVELSINRCRADILPRHAESIPNADTALFSQQQATLRDQAMTLLRSEAERLITVLNSSTVSDLRVPLKVSHKGSHAAQILKRLVLGRFAAIDPAKAPVHERGESYSLTLENQSTRMRFAVTASRKAIPWFNVTQSEVTKLSEAATVLLVIWNRDGEQFWCRRPFLFSIPTDELSAAIERNLEVLLRAMLASTARKLKKDGSFVPGLSSICQTKLDALTVVQPLEQLLDARNFFLDSFSNYAEAQTRSSPESLRVLTDLKESLATVLVHIQEKAGDQNLFSVRHMKTGTDLMTIDRTLWTAIDLTESEIDLLESSYSRSQAIEDEQEPDSTEPIGHPYDPTKSKIDSRPLTIDLLVKRIKEDEIDLAPPFQRKGGLWTQKQKSQLIESLLIRIPLPAFYFDATNAARWLVVDGLQRLTAFKDFILGEMRLEGLEYLTAWNNKTFAELPRPLRRDIEESQVTLHLIQPGTPPEVKFNIFRRVNTGGMVLTPQEIRHALNQGPVTTLLNDLAQSKEFLEATAHSVPTDRMVDREFVLRFLSFTLTSYEDYRIADLDAFLNAHMSRLNLEMARYAPLTKRFKQAMDMSHIIFGRHTFRKCQFEDQPRSPINKALFEAWSVTLGRLTPAQSIRIIDRRAEVKQKSFDLMDDDEFVRAISQGTADVAKVRLRFKSIESIVFPLAEVT